MLFTVFLSGGPPMGERKRRIERGEIKRKGVRERKEREEEKKKLREREKLLTEEPASLISLHSVLYGPNGVEVLVGLFLAEETTNLPHRRRICCAWGYRSLPVNEIHPTDTDTVRGNMVEVRQIKPRPYTRSKGGGGRGHCYLITQLSYPLYLQCSYRRDSLRARL